MATRLRSSALGFALVVATASAVNAAPAGSEHPRIRLGIVRSLIWLGRPADAHAHLEAALRWGAAPFDPEEYAEAVSHREAIARQVGVLVVRCRTEGARLTLDGKHLLECPGEIRQVVMPGQHQVLGRKAGYLTMTHEVACAPPPTVFATESRAKLENRIAISLWIVSGAAIASGLMMVYLASACSRVRASAASAWPPRVASGSLGSITGLRHSRSRDPVWRLELCQRLAG